MNYDSILTALDSNVVNRTEFFKAGETARDIGVGMSERAYALCNDDWIVGGLVLVGILMALILCRGWRLLEHHSKDFFSAKRRSTSDSIKDTGAEVAGVFLLVTVSAASLSVIYFNDLCDMCGFNPILEIPYRVLGMGLLAVLGFVIVKAFMYALVNWTFFDHESRRKWLMRYFFLTSLTAFLFYPLALVDVLIPISPDFVNYGVILTWFIYEILLFYRLLTNFIAKKHAYLLFLMYFCSVELVPALIMWQGLAWASGSFIVKNILF